MNDTPQALKNSYNISNEAWREYIYADDVTLMVEGAHTLFVDKREDGDRHRLIVAQPEGKEMGMYITPGWLAICWQTADGKHGITF